MHKSTLLSLGVAVIIAAAGCGIAHESKTGVGSPAHRRATVLRLATSFGVTGPLQPYADAVARASHGSLEIQEVPHPHPGDPAEERDIIADVRAGRTPLAVVGARVGDTVGLPDFDALIAPFLITTYQQEERALPAPFP